MAHPTGTSARVQRLTTLVAVIAVASATGFAYGRIYQGRATTAIMIGAGIASGLIAWAFERRSLLLATAVSAGTLVVAVALLLFPQATWYGLPTLDTVRAIADAAAQVGEQARLRVSPTEPIDPLVMAGLVGMWAALFSCHALAFRAGSPLLSLVPPLALVVFADSVLDEVTRPLFGVLFLVAALAVVFADAMRRLQGWGPIWTGQGRSTRLLHSTGRGARWIAAAAIAAAAIAPIVMPGFGSKAVIDISAVNRDDRVRVSALVSVAAQLTLSEPVDVFEVATEAPSYWRMTALDRFDGIRWSPSDEAQIPVTPGQELVEPWAPTTTSTFTVVNDVGYDWVPAGIQPNAIDIDAPVSWAPGTQTLRVDEPLDAGDTYSVAASYPTPRAADLRADGFGDAASYPDLVQLPPGLPPQIAVLAQEWTADATSDYDRIMALEARFNDATQFQYDLDVSPREDGESLLEFLTISRRGFCQQFASAMAVMLRSLGIPARVAVGYTTGTPIGTGDVRRVSTEDLHAWVEVLSPTYGWLPFEPTPTRDNPVMDSYAAGPTVSPEDPTGTGCTRRIATNPNCEDPAGIDRGSVPPRVDEDPFPSLGTDGLGDGGGLGLPIILALIVTALVGVAAITVPGRRIWHRRRLLRRAGDHPRRLILASYDVFADRAAELGLPRGIGETPREYAGRIVEDGRVRDGRVERLASLTTRAAYAAAEPTKEEALDAAADAHVTLQEITEATSLRRRVIGRLRLR